MNSLKVDHMNSDMFVWQAGVMLVSEKFYIYVSRDTR